MKVQVGPTVSVLALLCLGMTATAAVAEAAKKKEEPKKEGAERSFETAVKGMDVLEGLFTFYRQHDENKILMEIRPEQLEKRYLFAGSTHQAVGERGFYASMMGTDFPFVFRRVGKNVLWIQENTSFIAESGTPAARATERSFPDAILATAKIQSEVHPERKSLLVDAADLFSSRDLPGYVKGLEQAYKPTSFAFDKEGSAIQAVKVFPENVLLDVGLHYTTSNPKTFSIALADPRSVPVVVKYELSALKETTYRPRPADDRVGHFHTVQQDFTSDRPASPYVRHINRWNLEKADPSAALSPPKQPIVFWLENTIPVEYREWIREGALLWNRAFERIGFEGAIVVKQQPDDADWDPADTRYSTIRWFAGVDAAFAIGPSRANPFTGEIYDADIGISEGIIRSARRFAQEYVEPVAPESEGSFTSPWSRNPRFQCGYARGLAEQAALGLSVFDARGELTSALEQKLMREYVIELSAHEVGHTLGLRHNFRASTILGPEELNDTKRTQEVGQSASVMDYNPIVIAAKAEVQGDFVPTTLGTYDYWAIEYAYKPIDGDEADELARIAARGAGDSLLPYSTDEDALGTYSARSIDPLANQFDASGDPLAFFEKRIQIIHELWNSMETNLAKPGEGYQVMRRALSRGLRDYHRALLTSSKLVGGVYHYRDHVGDPGGRAPFEPVPADRQRAALAFLSRHAFDEESFNLAPSLLNKLAIERLPDLNWPDYWNVRRIDYPWHDAVLEMQSRVLDRLFDPITLGRVLDNELRFAAGQEPFRMIHLFGGLDDAIWSEVGAGVREISSLRRNLQREHLKHLVRLALRRTPEQASASSVSAAPAAPEDAATLARASLTSLSSRIRRRLAAEQPLEATTRAHLQETRALITAALEAQMEKRLN